ncbi:hypothetical protein BCR36DRAFT_372763 [Piromyces finnis]|uniref:Uncharacterized protein n=1 Tax=Piromyces finnis TaxID=1754191 RepID=A0A1Y1V217_9FUNG|nr:hypothetical protein BCR36DRAFT_372763 [Piromyces finnis]|eukprot:ORX45400.1 hypothetical protein BCR36DRAFT_372763 [Piromyces finnis]
MSSTNVNFSCDKLVGCENFPIWYITISDYLKSLKLNLYIETNVTSNITDPTTEMDHNANDAKASIIILTNVIDKIKYYIKDCSTAYEKMEKLKSLYEVDKATFCGMWMKRLYSIRAKSVRDTMEIINEILELFKLLKESLMEPPKIEQITIMYDALPKELKSIVTYGRGIL